MLSWYVVYKDKSEHHYDPKTFNIAHIDIDKLDHIVMKDPKALIPFFILHFDDKRKKPIFVIRNELPNPPNKPFHTRCYMVGWQIRGTDIQVINYVFETIGRKILVDHPTIPNEKTEIVQEMYWIESAGAFDKHRDSWFKSPKASNLATIGSKVK